MESTNPQKHNDNTAFPPLNMETRATLTTACAAHHLHRSTQTLRGWACNEDGPTLPDGRRFLPVRLMTRRGPLLWRTDEVRALVGESVGSEPAQEAA